MSVIPFPARRRRWTPQLVECRCGALHLTVVEWVRLAGFRYCDGAVHSLWRCQPRPAVNEVRL